MTRHTVGKVTYIHGAQPLKARLVYGEDGRIASADMMAGLDDPALQQQPKPIPVMVIGDELAPDEPSISYYFGTDIPRPDEPDEFEVWSSHQTRSPKSPERIRWSRIALWLVIISICPALFVVTGVFVFGGGLSDFFRTTLATLISTIK